MKRERERERLEYIRSRSAVCSELFMAWPVVYISNCCIRTQIIANTAEIIRLLFTVMRPAGSISVRMC